MKALIAINRHFYGPKSTVELLKCENGPGDHPEVFQSEEAAQKWVQEKDSEIYHTRHNEASRPDFVVITTSAENGDEARSIYNEGQYDDLLANRGEMISA